VKTKRLKKDMAEHKAVGVDTGVFVRHFQGNGLADLTSVVLNEIQCGSCQGIVSSISLTELMVRPLQAGEDDLADLYRVLIHEMPNLETVSVCRREHSIEGRGDTRRVRDRSHGKPLAGHSDRVGRDGVRYERPRTETGEGD
jgi:hypothetical protein